MGAGLGGLALLPVIYALVLCFTLLSGPHSSEGWWWLLIFAIAASYGLATPTALRLWKRGVEGLQESGHDRDRALWGRGTTLAPAAAARYEGHAERQLLETIERHGEITPVRVALETALTVAEADRMLGELAEKGHLEVRARDGKLVYSF
ncbi:MAG: hypothetical protein M3P49_13375 [Actinomycetota bacterium]|nr:hypothetical protein [Actinomycetota bacterium]